MKGNSRYANIFSSLAEQRLFKQVSVKIRGKTISLPFERQNVTAISDEKQQRHV